MYITVDCTLSVANTHVINNYIAQFNGDLHIHMDSKHIQAPYNKIRHEGLVTYTCMKEFKACTVKRVHSGHHRDYALCLLWTGVHYGQVSVMDRCPL